MIPFSGFGWPFLFVIFILGIAALALPLPIVFAMQSFGASSWAARRALLASVACYATGYLAAFAYYSIRGLPDAEAAQSAAGQAVWGAFIVGGYGSLAAFRYFYWHRNNPERADQRTEGG